MFRQSGAHLHYAHLRLNEDITSNVREAIIASTMGDPESNPIDPDTLVSQGEILSSIGPFYSSWPHLHFGIVDGDENYDGINPLTALDRTYANVDLFDDEPPVISELELFEDGTTTDATPTDACDPLSGAVDIAATMSDSFYTNPAPAPFTGGVFTSFGVYKASWQIRNVETGMGDGDIWYELDRAPLACAGPDRGNACPTTILPADFPDYSFEYDDGMLIMGEPYTPLLFSTSQSYGNYNAENQEHYVHLLTNTWGEEGNWNTASVPDGWYQVTAIAEDADGNQDSETRFVAIENDGNYSNVGDAYVRDNDDESGEIPSTVADDNNYAQRNIQFGVTSFWFNNPGLTSASVGTELRCNGFPFKNPNSLMELRVAYNTFVYQAWLNTPGTVVTLSGGNIVVRFTRCNVKLPAVQLPGNTKLAASFKTVLPGNITGSWLLDLKGSLNGVLRGGMSFLAKSP
jgi:hypothetical protein